jgi:lipopolysaccharide export system permease protein
MDETLTPWANRRVREFRREKIAELPPHSVRRKNVYYMGRGQKFYYISRVDGKRNLLQGITIFEFTDDYKVKRRIIADKAVYSDGWLLTDGMIVEFKKEGETVSHFKELKAYDIEDKLEDFTREARGSEEMNFFELNRYISWLRHTGKEVTKEYVDLHTKISFPFMNLIIIFLGAPLAVRVRRSGFVLGFAISLFMSFVYWSLSQTTRAFGQAGDIPAWLAAWLPSIVFGVLGGVLLWNINK